GDIMSVFTNDIDTLRQMVGRSVPQHFSSVITIVSTLTSMIVLSVPLTLISIATTVVALVLSVKLAKTSRMYFKARQMNLAKVNGYIEEMVSGQKVVKVFCHEDEVMTEFKVLSENLRRSVNDANRVANIIMPINGNIANIGFVLIAIVGAAITIKFPESSLTIGTVVSFLTLHRNFSRPVSQISQEANSIAMASAGAERVYAMADEKGETDSGEVVLDNVSVGEDGSMKKSDIRTGSWAWQKGEDLVRLEGKVSLSDVDFGYVPEKQVLYDISLTAYPGQKIAFVGGTGAGKTTITNLINRFYDIQDGVITYDDIDVKDIRKDSLRSSLGIVLQETHLFTGTILENIRYGRLDATDRECVEAAKMVYADSFIRRLPNGYNTVIDGEGESLSQGERQLLSIARTAVANPPVLILDEATSSIDTRTERLIQKAMDKIMRGRTTFVIAHRLSTVQNADYIIVLEKGRIIEAGKHFELLDRKGKYFELFTGGSVVN
ncbi:MAG: ABC transporter ATP-binding protein/permease, partial [Bacteroidales bacterium]|nr:ABC transporter ATP-binding protein/permease [Bacteroidales bacterium]